MKPNPIWKQHQELLSDYGVDFDKIIELRKAFHRHPEGGFKEFKTQEKIRQALLDFGIEKDNIRPCSTTGLVVDITGTGPESSEGECTTVAYRADMDGLPMKEDSGVEYTSETEYAHMCGHDGHMATLLATAQFWAKHKEKLPKNKSIRLLFQPAEEGPGGAKGMIDEGCMEGVDEVYGYHNAPFGEEGSISIKPGEFMAGVVYVKIHITGQGGHGSEPGKSIDPITAACNLHNALHTIKSRKTLNTDIYAFTICEISSGSTFNVIPRTAFMQGTIRTYRSDVRDKVKEMIKTLSNAICEGFGCSVDVELEDGYPAVINHDKQTKIFTDIAKEELGEDKVNEKEHLPWFASEDFSYFLQEKPGAFVALNNVRAGEEPVSLHNSKMDFNDNIISTGAYLNIKLSEDRLGVKFF